MIGNFVSLVYFDQILYVDSYWQDLSWIDSTHLAIAYVIALDISHNSSFEKED